MTKFQKNEILLQISKLNKIADHWAESGDITTEDIRLLCSAIGALDYVANGSDRASDQKGQKL